MTTALAPAAPSPPMARMSVPDRAAIETRLREREAELAAMGDEGFEAEDVERRVALQASIAELRWVLGRPATEDT